MHDLEIIFVKRKNTITSIGQNKFKIVFKYRISNLIPLAKNTKRQSNE